VRRLRRGVQYLQRAHAAALPAAAVASSVAASGVLHFAANAPQMATLKIAAVSAVPLPASAALNGRIAYDENVTTRVSSPVLGRVLALHADSGDRVARGALLADLDSPDLASAEADWRKAQADEVRKQLAYQRADTLFRGEVLARKDYESADADFQQARAETRRAALRMHSLNAAGSDNGRFALRAPLAGTIADRQINPGQEVRPDARAPVRHQRPAPPVAAGRRAGKRPGQRAPGPGRQRRDGCLPGTPLQRHGGARGAGAGPADAAHPGALHAGQRRWRPEAGNVRARRLRPATAARWPWPCRIPACSPKASGYVFVEKQPGTFEKRRVSVRVKDATAASSTRA
jgi:cobalt-zinc-cadmium efflux system membrane fusion protein